MCQTTFQKTPILISYKSKTQPCVKNAVLIRLEPNKKACPEAKLVLDWYDLWRKGTHVIWFTPLGIHLENVSETQGQRPWTRKAIPRKERPVKREHFTDLKLNRQLSTKRLRGQML